MKTVDLAEAAKALADYAHALGEVPLILTEDDKPIAALVSLQNVDAESLALSTDPEFLEIIRAARAEAAGGAVVSLKEMKREVLE